MKYQPVNTIHIKTYGCQMNIYDSYKIKSILLENNFIVSEDINQANIIIYNTCNIRQKPANKLYSELGKIRNSNKNVIIAGCVAQAEGEEIFRKSDIVNAIVGPQSYYDLPYIIKTINKQNKINFYNIKFNPKYKFDYINKQSVNKYSSFISIQEGCNKFCSFCCVPYTRGQEYSRNIQEIYKEIKYLTNINLKEITLLGQNVSSYYGKNKQHQLKDLSYLIYKIASINKIKRIKYITSHPTDMNNQKLILCHKKEKKLLPYIHLPIQSGSNKILNNMNRKHNIKYYLKIIDKYKDINKIEFSSDFIVGYPNEDKEDFQLTLDVINKIKYIECFFYKYSIRAGTTSSIMYNQIPENIKKERLYILSIIANNNKRIFNNKYIQNITSVLFEKKESKNYYWGKSEFLQNIIVKSSSNILGKLLNVKIIRNINNKLYGKLI